MLEWDVLLRGWDFEVSPPDPRVLGSVCVVLLVVSVAASLIPGLRAARVDPVAALKTE